MSYVGPGQVVYRSRCGDREAEVDRQVLWWIGRFRYTSVELLSLRFGVAAQNTRVRLKRLEAGGMVRLERRSLTEPWMVSLTARGARAIGQPARKAPRAELHQAHELAIGWLCARLERRQGAEGMTVLTEREVRQREQAHRPHSTAPSLRLALPTVAGRPRSHWPDLVLLHDDEPVRAIELEFTQKSDQRLEEIIDAYHDGPYPDVLYLTADAHLATKLLSVIEQPRLRHPHQDTTVNVRIAPWPRAPAPLRAAVHAAVHGSQPRSTLDDDRDL